MSFPFTARYAMVMVYTNKFFIDEKITTFPVDPFQIIKNNKWGLVTYSELAKEHEVWIEDIIAAFQSEDGYTMYDGKNYTIAYNDTIQNQGRIRFTLLHEIGHIYMKHLEEFEETILTRSTLTESKYKILENEANAFARNVLSPVMVVKDLGLNTPNDLVSFFDISISAAEFRLKVMIHDYRNILAPFIQFQRKHFKSYIYASLYSKSCFVCSHYFINENATHCPICGNQSLTNKRDVDKMIYKGYLLDENSRAVVCPQCENEHLNYKGDICKICGAEIVNKCEATYRQDHTGWTYWQESCETLLDGDARFCIKCGNNSSFHHQGFFEDWTIEKAAEKDWIGEAKKEYEMFLNKKKLEKLPS